MNERSGGERRGRDRHRRPIADLPRLTAHKVLSAVETDGAYANLALPHALADAGLHGRDSAFVTEIVYGTLRFQRRYDAMIRRGLEGRSVGSLQPALRIALRMGAHQLHAMRIPERAAVYETVNMVKVVAGHAPVALANAVLRKTAARSFDEWHEIIEGQDGMAAWESHPDWVVSAFRQALTLEGRRDELRELLQRNNTAGPVTLVARPGLIDPGELLRDIPEAERTPYSPVGLWLRGGAPGDIPAVRSGHAGVQDEGSQLMAYLLADAPLDGSDARWLDMTAGPGGKAALLGALARQRGAHLLANELQEHRTELVRRAVRPLGNTVEVVTGDGRDIGRAAPGRFDRILLDAPCTGLGSLRRRPESRWRRTEGDLHDLTLLQRQLLDSSIDALRPGGVLAYVTCSPHLAETVSQVSAVLRRGVSLLDAPEVLARFGVPRRGRAAHPLPQTAQLWPHEHGTDAMFGALLRKDS
ncbi:MAG TPA: transcription antitermination factor NusB [Actinomycetaceae bacterium]|nr:transcription antitermination factor NusB [Actinomycetaceae bacterium]